VSDELHAKYKPDGGYTHMNKKTESAIIEARKLMRQTDYQRDNRIPLLKIAVTLALLFGVWCYHDRMTKKIEFLEAAVADLNIRLYQFGLDGGIR
jgi:hypothetical protein